jgi:long-subunit acyl-CoA synthetase (AMP-forming)
LLCPLQTIAAIVQPAFGILGRTCFAESVGILAPGQEARILRDDGTEADFDEVGEMYLRGKNVAMGYWNNEKATRGTFLEGGWLRTGDRFKVDKNGNFL